MASATFENGQAVRAASAAIRAGRARAHGAERSGGPRCAQAGGALRRNAEQRFRAPVIWRGVGASVAIASGYVALVTAIRWLFLLT